MSKKILVTLPDEIYDELKKLQLRRETAYAMSGHEYNKTDSALCRDIIKNYLEYQNR